MIKKNIAFCRLPPVGRLSSFPMHGRSTSFSCIETSVYWHSFVSLLFSLNCVLAAKQTVTTSSLSLKKTLHLLFLLCSAQHRTAHYNIQHTALLFNLFAPSKPESDFLVAPSISCICVCSSILIFCSTCFLN